MIRIRRPMQSNIGNRGTSSLFAITIFCLFSSMAEAFSFPLIGGEDATIIARFFGTSSMDSAKQWIEERDCGDETTDVDQLLAVVDLFYSISEATNSTVLQDEMLWLSSCNPCVYSGIFCDYTNRINSIDLAGMGLKGTIPSSIGLLTGIGTFLGIVLSELACSFGVG